MKKLIILSVLMLVSFTSSFAAVTIRYYNKDSKSYTFKVNLDGNSKEVTFDASKTSSVTVQGSGTVCKIETSCGTIEIKDGMSIEIKDGCIYIK